MKRKKLSIMLQIIGSIHTYPFFYMLWSGVLSNHNYTANRWVYSVILFFVGIIFMLIPKLTN